MPRLDHRLEGPARRKEDYDELVAPYLRPMDEELGQVAQRAAGG